MASPSALVDREQIRRKGFAEFVKRAWHQVEAADLVFEPHMDLICAHYEAVSRGEIKDLVVAIPPGMAQPHSEPILLERGWVPMGEVRPGDRVYGSDGMLHDVLRVHPQGPREVWEVEFSDGSVVRCEARHLWTFEQADCQGSKAKKPDPAAKTEAGRRGRLAKRAPNVTKTTAEWAETTLRKQAGAHLKSMFFCPVAAPIQRPEAALPLDPYTLGLLLGDGCLDYTPSFTSIDGLEQSLVLPEGVHLKLEKKQGTDAIQAILTTGTRGKGEWNHNPLTAILRDLRLHGTRSHTKFIPSAYMTASPAQRLALLQGLLDTDGHNSGPSAVLSTVSETMADQAKELVESLGGVCAKHDYATSYTYKGEKKAGKRVFSLRMTFPSGVVPFRLRRKVDAFVSHPRQRAPRRAVVSIRPTGVVEECSCIEVSAPDHLYVTKHHVLTHNSKSLISSILYPAWDWIQNPWRKFIFVTYDKDLSYDFARRSMALMQSDWFRERWSDWEILGGDRASAGLFKNSAGGVRFSTMMGGAATGRHAHTLIVDDPIKPADLNVGGSSAKNVLDEAWTRWSETFCRRVADAEKFAKVCIMQRLHEEDLAGRMIKDPKTVHLCLPMRFEPKRAYKSKWGSDWRTEEGELLAPKRFPADYVDDIEHGPTGMTPRAFAAQMQQRPAPEAGALFMREWFAKRWEAHPTGVRWCMSVDASLKDNNDSDYGVIQVWAWRGAEFFLMDQHRARMAFSATVAAVKAMKTKWPLVGQILIEDKANGTAVVDTLKRSIPGVMAVTPEGGKFSRAQAVEPYFRAGNVSFPPDHLASWMPGLIEEFATFPVGSFDDSVDSASQALLFMSGRSRVTRFKAAMNNARSNLTANPRLRYRG